MQRRHVLSILILTSAAWFACDRHNAATSAPSGGQSGDAKGAGGAPGAPEILFDLEHGDALAIHVDDRSVYFSGRGGNGFRGASFKRGPKEGGVFEVVAPWSGQRGVSLIQSDAAHVFFLYRDVVLKYSKESGALTELALGEEYRVLASDESALYLAHVGCRGLGSIPKSGGDVTAEPVPEATGDGGTTLLIADAENLYCAHSDRIFRKSKGGGPPTTFISNQQSVRALDQDAGHVYWIDVGQSPYSTQTVYRAAKPDGEAVVIGVSPKGGANPVMHVDAGRGAVFWKVETSFRSELRAMSLADGSTTVLLKDRGFSGGLTGDDEYLYWLEKQAEFDGGKGLVVRMRKPD